MTDSNGKLTISELVEGEYLFVQADNKDKYTVQTMLVQVPEVDTDGNYNYTITATPKISEIVYIENETTTNNFLASGTTLPFTGIQDWQIPVLVIIAIVLFCIGWLKAFTTSKKKVN
jgi:hypothetical protein